MKKKFVLHYPNLLIALITLISILILVSFLRRGVFTAAFLAVLVFLGISWFIFLIDHLLKLRFPPLLYNLYLFFIIITVFFGYLLNFYLLFSWYNRLTHFLGGILAFILGLYLIIRLDNIGYLKFSLVLTYALFFAGFAVSLWSLTAGMIAKWVAGRPLTDLAGEIAFGIIGVITAAILLILDNSLYHNRFLEHLLTKMR
jgi:hypothetical protein